MYTIIIFSKFLNILLFLDYYRLRLCNHIERIAILPDAITPACNYIEGLVIYSFYHVVTLAIFQAIIFGIILYLNPERFFMCVTSLVSIIEVFMISYIGVYTLHYDILRLCYGPDIVIYNLGLIFEVILLISHAYTFYHIFYNMSMFKTTKEHIQSV